jgi:hypothetical protein
MVRILLLFMAVSMASCTKDRAKMDNTSETNQDIGMPAPSLDSAKDENNYIFNYASSGYFDDYPITIDEVKEQYPNESFKEETEESFGPLGHYGKYRYDLISANISFGFFGNSRDKTKLYEIAIHNPAYQNKDIQVIGISMTGIKGLLNGNKVKYRESDGIHAIVILFDDESYLGIKVTADIVTGYTILY